MSLRAATLRIALLLVVAILAHAQQPLLSGATSQAEIARPAIGRKLALAGVPNFGEVTPHLYRGAQPDAAGFAALAQKGINIVVDLRGNRRHERDEVTRLGMRYAAIPWHCPHPKDAVFAEFLTLLRQNPDAKVFVHCLLGDDRTGMAIAAFRMAEQGWTAEEAKGEMVAFGFRASHHVLCPGLAGYEKRFPLIYRSSPAFENLRSAPAASP